MSIVRPDRQCTEKEKEERGRERTYVTADESYTGVNGASGMAKFRRPATRAEKFVYRGMPK